MGADMGHGTARLAWIYGAMPSPWIYDLVKCIDMNCVEDLGRHLPFLFLT